MKEERKQNKVEQEATFIDFVSLILDPKNVFTRKMFTHSFVREMQVYSLKLVSNNTKEKKQTSPWSTCTTLALFSESEVQALH